MKNANKCGGLYVSANAAFFWCKWKYPATNDWVDQVKQDLVDFNIEVNLDTIRSFSNYSFKNLVPRIQNSRFLLTSNHITKWVLNTDLLVVLGPY